MNTKFTSGPWFGGVTLSGKAYCIIGDGDSVVCEFPGRTGATFCADVRLIAAAPELLALAKEVADNVILAGMEIGQRARELIAKATGEQA